MPFSPRTLLASTVSRTGVLSLVLATGFTISPVVGGHGRAAPHPVATHVTQLGMDRLPVSRTAGAGSRKLTTSDEVATGMATGSLVGVTWPHEQAPPAGTTLRVRGLRDDGTWTAWTQTEVSAEDDSVATRAGRKTRVGTEPVWTGPVTRVQIRYDFAEGRIMRRGRVEVVAPGSSPADVPATTPAGAATAVPAQPRIISRRGWGADESMRTCTDYMASTTSAMVVHHTAGTNSYTAAQSASIVRGIYAYHVNGQGWCDIGYNALVDKFGQIFEGRYGGLDLPVIGAHTGGFNTDTFGVSVLGTYDSVAPSSSALSALTTLMAWRESMFYRNATSSSVLTSRSSTSKYPEGTRVTVPFIVGHRDLWPTGCPGAVLYGRLGTIRSTVQSKTSFTSSAIYKRWAASGGLRSALGPVLKGEGPVSFGRRTVFQRGFAMYAVGSSTRLVGPGNDRLYWHLGGPAVWGAPLADEAAVPGGSQVAFQDGHLAVYSSATGAQPLFGAIRGYWLAPGAGLSPVGYPRTAESVLPSGGVVQTFTQGNVYYRSGLGAHGVSGRILLTYLQRGGPAGALGYPTGEQRTVGTTLVQAFQGGTVTVPISGPTAPTPQGTVVRRR
ncbi:N-acetylmuramoyl-L-alanine amidase [Phycicoccus sp. M110.8]|uniref:N-acetylmuramoyl-L-alanine amidase n=1 Tax=Phycicoccus sp. M110.8 TaxID=3075433 RepID=UPI0028FDAAC7|nr:N-acetylmuramoyl-L-alanine amidase [Phycicoccus sp. M110.8]MDU0312703.1 N-acetylmuramoyl-L-alanine amidase [Phycicoccus sp. M110.8]